MSAVPLLQQPPPMTMGVGVGRVSGTGPTQSQIPPTGYQSTAPHGIGIGNSNANANAISVHPHTQHYYSHHPHAMSTPHAGPSYQSEGASTSYTSPPLPTHLQTPGLDQNYHLHAHHHHAAAAAGPSTASSSSSSSSQTPQPYAPTVTPHHHQEQQYSHTLLPQHHQTPYAPSAPGYPVSGILPQHPNMMVSPASIPYESQWPEGVLPHQAHLPPQMVPVPMPMSMAAPLYSGWDDGSGAYRNLMFGEEDKIVSLDPRRMVQAAHSTVMV